MPPRDQLVALYKKQGWNDEAAINADINAGGWRSKIQAPTPGFSFTQPSQPSTSFQMPQINEEEVIKQREEVLTKAKEPIISQLESEKDPLRQRYDRLIGQILSQKEKTIGESDISTAVEFGKRGIPISSGVVGDTQLKRRTGIETEFGGIEIGAEGELQDRLSQLNKDIATLKASVSPEAFSQAMSLIGSRLQQYQTGKGFDLQEQQLALQREQAQKPDTQVVESGGRVKLINTQTGEVISDLGSSSSGSAGVKESSIRDLQNDLSRGITFRDAHLRYDSKLGVDAVSELYNVGSIYGPAKETQTLEEKKYEDLSSKEESTPWWRKAASVFGIY